jgi:GT2 family glycosyltransferase
MNVLDDKYKYELSIVVVSWNVKQLLHNCIESIYEKTKGMSFEIIVFDNASVDGSVEMITSNFPDVKIITSSNNIGFGLANNKAFAHTCGKYIALLNPDTVLINNAFRLLIDKLEDEPEIGIIGPMLLLENKSIHQICARRFVTIQDELRRLLGLGDMGFRHPVLRVSQDLQANEYRKSQRVDCISGACMLLRRECLPGEYIFDPQFFMYAEDVDLCWEAIDKGWNVYYLSEARITHFGGESAKQDINTTLLYSMNSSYLFVIKRYGLCLGYWYRCLVAVIFGLKCSISGLMRLVLPYKKGKKWINLYLLHSSVFKSAINGFKIKRI